MAMHGNLCIQSLSLLFLHRFCLCLLFLSMVHDHVGMLCASDKNNTAHRMYEYFSFGKSPSVHGYIGRAPRALAGNVFFDTTRKLCDVVALDFVCVCVRARLQHTNAKMYRSPCSVR